ncbi:MAG: ankyrin repeat domain-containing protein [Candidatus Berkiellales bacterium]
MSFLTFKNYSDQELNNVIKLIKAAQEGDGVQLNALIAAEISVNNDRVEPENPDYNPLYQAAEKNQFGSVKILVQHQANVNYAGGGSSVLSAAVKTGNAEMVKYLLEKGATTYLNKEAPDLINYIHGNGELPLATAADSGFVEIAKILIDHGADVNARTGWFGKSTPLTYASANADIPMMKLLIDNGAQVNTFARSKEDSSVMFDAFLTSSLFNALTSKNHDAVKLIVDAGGNDLGWSPLHLAIVKQNLPAAEEALQALSDNHLVNTKDILGFSPIHYALLGKDNSFLEFLANHGADTKLTESNISLLNGAVFLDVPKEMFQWVTNHTANVDTPFAETTTLALAANQGRLEHIKLLLDKGANINLKGSDGNTPLHAAISEKQVEAVKQLIEYGADLHAKNANGLTAFDQAKNLGDLPADLVLTLDPKNQVPLETHDLLVKEDPIKNLDAVSSHSDHSSPVEMHKAHDMSGSVEPSTIHVFLHKTDNVLDNHSQHAEAPV